MINLKPTNLKLKERVISIVQQICHTEYEETVKYLEENQWQIRKAIENINKK
jgi:N-acetylmuramic acid 6-phosphate (MurNAc-6-P) etherase